ncbi:DUF445 domain-containing protein [Noviherbaspirillum denitrificans]|uniref:DUF445 domain-containing protein n=1 Tax=Noviherbaspirillum denitrificans TaxID=1968433 RepID=A0A254TIA0_9BURK|nr:DUF445 domain-containing protein [Noviherbaspirillum denitrificans]OWW22356.1 hypothetical protein AYR66_25535 [Noviherbaspirillum denitrificans]
MHEQEQAVQLRKTRGLATGLLVAMAFLFLVSRSLMPRYPYLSFVAAFAEAAMVGALADWFAVTALFRHPLGVPIPHTAIIPRNKDRIADSLSNFLEHNFITQEIIRAEMRPIDFAGAAAAWLSQPENSKAISRQIVRSVPTLLRVIEDEDVRQFMHGRLTSALAHAKFAPMVAEVLSVLVASNRHQALFNQLIEVAARALEHNKDYIRWKIHENSPRWLPKAIDEKFYHRLLDAVESTLNEMREEDSEWRLRFSNMAEDFIEQLRTSPVYEEKLDTMISEVLGHPITRDYMLHIWRDIKTRLEADIASPDSHIAARLDQGFRSFGNELLGDARVQRKLNQWIRIFATETIVARREMIADLVVRVIRKWDADTMSRKLELHVGKDLQYIRINGTLVGGLVGLVLHAISRFL